MSPPVPPDPEELLKRLGGNRALLAELIEIFRTEGPNYLEMIGDGIARNDPCAVRQASHLLRGALSYFGAAPACELAERLEQLGRSEQLAGAAEAWSRLDIQLRTLLEELKGLTTNGRSQPGDASS